jgi:dUTP pyrophosphatase
MKKGIKLINNSNNPDPVYSTKGSAGMDIRAFLDTDVVMKKDDIKIIPTGLYVEIPKGYEIQVRSRSGLAAKYGVTVLNSPGTIDSDYRGEIKVILHSAKTYFDENMLQKPFTIKNGDRVAQIVLNKVETIKWEEAFDLNETQRDTGGLGSTGIK